MERVNRSKNSKYIRTVVGLALLTAIVFVVQFIAATIKLGTFSITFALMPIVIGAALYGVAAGAWLGLVFGIVVLLSGDAAPFLAVNAPATILVVLLKGMLAGVAASCIYKLFAEKESTGKITIIVSGSLLALGGGFLVSLGGRFDLETNFTAALTCVSNVGPGFGAVVGPAGNFAGFSPFSKIVLSILMLAGRLEIYPILVLFHPALWHKS